MEVDWQRAAIAAWGNSRSWDQVAREALGQMQAAAREAGVMNEA